MRAQEVRNKYIEMLKKDGHVILPRASLVPREDPTVLFTGSGMQPLLPYLLGESHPKGTRLGDSQTCLRAQDIDDVGDNRHTTFFEMLGNWSLGDYFKKQQIPRFFNYLIDDIGLDPNKIYATCFIGDPDNNLPKDEETAQIWQDIFKAKGIDAKIKEMGSADDGGEKGMDDARIFYYDAGENWWSRAGEPANMPAGEPGGPDSEVFYVFEHVEHDKSFGENCHPACDCGRFMEIGNSVFMEYLKNQDGTFSKLPKQNVDFGGGLERITAASEDTDDVFKISILWPIIEKLEQISGLSYQDNVEAMRVIADHLRASMFLAVDGVRPSNKEQGYVMRRLVRRAILKAFNLGVEQNFLEEIGPVITSMYKDDYPEVTEAEDEVVGVLVKEEKAFKQTLRKGLRELEKEASIKWTGGKAFNVADVRSGKLKPEYNSHLMGDKIFELYDTYGFPVELTLEEAEKLKMKVDSDWRKDFDAKMTEQRMRSQTATKGTFKGGLGGKTLQHKKYHTATHLTYQALRDVLGDHVIQRGSNITEERLRFDFSHPEKMTPEQIKQVEDIVNQQIKKDLKVSFAEYPTEEATGPLGALGQFGDRYGDTVKVYSMQADDEEKPFSFEICGGPHVDHTLQLIENGETYKIIKEESSSAGIRRVKAVLR